MQKTAPVICFSQCSEQSPTMLIHIEEAKIRLHIPEQLQGLNTLNNRPIGQININLVPCEEAVMDRKKSVPACMAHELCNKCHITHCYRQRGTPLESSQ